MMDVKEECMNMTKDNVLEKMKIKHNHISFNLSQIDALKNIQLFQLDSLEKFNSLIKNGFLYYEYIHAIAPSFDLDQDHPYNGYRTLLNVYECCLVYCNQILDSASRQQVSVCEEDLVAAYEVLHTGTRLLEFSKTLYESTSRKSLFLHDEKVTEILEAEFEDVSRAPFYGKCTGLYYPSGFRYLLEGMMIAVASFGHAYYSVGNLIRKSVVLCSNFVKYSSNRAGRGQFLVKLDKEVLVDFPKFIMSNVEKMSNFFFTLVKPHLNVDATITMPQRSFSLPKEKELGYAHIEPVEPITCRHLSMFHREKSKSSGKPLSPLLIIYIHGGYITLSTSQSEVFLREWAQKLEAPTYSIDYTLGPDAGHPEQGEEVYFAYAWALSHLEELGSTGERIVVLADSAGGMLAVNLTQKCVKEDIRKPDGLVLLYPHLHTYSWSPSNLLTLIDPLLFYGILKLGINTIFSEKQQKNKGDPCLNPFIVSSSMLSEMPPTMLISTDIDPTLDDAVEFARLLRSSGILVDLHIFEGVPHGFPFWKHCSADCSVATNHCLQKIQQFISKHITPVISNGKHM